MSLARRNKYENVNVHPPPPPELIRTAAEAHWDMIQRDLDREDRGSTNDSSNSNSPHSQSDFEFVDPDASHSFELVDDHLISLASSGSGSHYTISRPSSSNGSYIGLLQKDSVGVLFSDRDKDFCRIELPRGSLLCEVTSASQIEKLQNAFPSKLQIKDPFYGSDLLCSNKITVVWRSDLMMINNEQATLLLSCSPAERWNLYHDLERFHFVELLKEGDEVNVEIASEEESDDSQSSGSGSEPKVMYHPGRVTRVGEMPERLGRWFQVDLRDPGFSDNRWMSVPHWENAAAPGTVFANANQLHKPTRSTISQPPQYHHRSNPTSSGEVRNIPIRRVVTTFDAEPEAAISRQVEYPNVPSYNNRGQDPNEVFTRELSAWDGDPRSLNDPMREWRSRENRDRDREDFVERKYQQQHPQQYQQPSQQYQQQSQQYQQQRSRLPSTSSSSQNQPPRSQSAHVVRQATFDRTFSIDDPIQTKGAKVGDRCAWRDDHRRHLGTIRFIGHLKGHSNLYAGVEFDDAVGKGTGVYQGETVFVTPENRAGFVILSTLELLPKPESSIKAKQASAESLNLGEYNNHARKDAPNVPPRPHMQAEDYMLDGFAQGSSVEVCHLGACRYGVVRWVGDSISEDKDHLERSAVVELDGEVPHGWRLASPSIYPGSMQSPTVARAVLVPTYTLRRDRRLPDNDSPTRSPSRANGHQTDFGSIDSGIETSPCVPWKITDDLIGRMKGIQGHRNSCYLDATLYAMFSQSTAFDFLLERPRKSEDIPEYQELIRLLATEIVYPLRKFHYVRADHVMKVRELLSKVLPMRGLTTDEKDPEEVLIAVFQQVLKTKPFLQLINLSDKKTDHEYLCQLVVEDWPGEVATTQHLLERSMRAANIRFAVPPKNLIVQLPRYGQQKVFDKVLPLEKIDITGLVMNAAVPCHSCSKPADGMCPECFLCKQVFITEVSFCESCFEKQHVQANEADHSMRHYYPVGKPVKKTSSYKMILSAVLCIETSHYVAFVRSQSGRWLFFDSMADREGLNDGFNVPQVKECERLSQWLSLAGWDRLRKADSQGNTKAMLGKGSDVDPLVNRILSDSYICFYQEDPSSSPSSSSSGLLNNIKGKIEKIKL